MREVIIYVLSLTTLFKLYLAYFVIYHFITLMINIENN